MDMDAKNIKIQTTNLVYHEAHELHEILAGGAKRVVLCPGTGWRVLRRFCRRGWRVPQERTQRSTSSSALRRILMCEPPPGSSVIAESDARADGGGRQSPMDQIR